MQDEFIFGYFQQTVYQLFQIRFEPFFRAFFRDAAAHGFKSASVLMNRPAVCLKSFGTASFAGNDKALGVVLRNDALKSSMPSSVSNRR